MEFHSFSKILHIGKAFMTITQKIHGSNAQILIYEKDGAVDLTCGSRSRWIIPEDDNYGFASFVHKHKEEFIDKLGIGRHFGEWAGKGINSGEGLSHKTFFLFNHVKFLDPPLPPNTSIVPVLYKGKMDMTAIDETMERLKTNGSYICPGYMKPEGIVIEIDGQRYKKVFEPEEVAWKQTKKAVREPKIRLDICHLLQPMRLEKLLSRDEHYIREYPVSLPSICKDYVKDLEEENCIVGDEDEINAIKKELGAQVFRFVKAIVGAK